MSLIIAARLITWGCRSQVLSFNLTSTCQKVIHKTNKFEIIIPVIQQRWLSDRKKIEVNNRNDTEQIYSGNLSKKIKVVKLFSLSTSFLSIVSQPYLINSVLSFDSIVPLCTVLLVTGFFAFGTPMILHLLTKKYVTKIYYNPITKLYTATTYSLFAREKKLEFTPNDVEQPALTQMFTSCYIKSEPMFLDVADFTDPKHYCTIMNYDKPMDFGIGVTNNDNKNNNEQYQDIRVKKSMRN